MLASPVASFDIKMEDIIITMKGDVKLNMQSKYPVIALV